MALVRPGCKNRVAQDERNSSSRSRVGTAETLGRFACIHAVAARIPRGRVATYGQLARLAGLAGQARLVGYALAALDDRSRIPWHRVVNARGQVSVRRGGGMDVVQRLRLQREGVRFDGRGSIDLARFRWRPRAV